MGIVNKLTNVFLDIFYQCKILEDIVPRKHKKSGKSILQTLHSASCFFNSVFVDIEVAYFF